MWELNVKPDGRLRFYHTMRAASFLKLNSKFPSVSDQRKDSQKPDGKRPIAHTRKHDTVIMCMAAPSAALPAQTRTGSARRGLRGEAWLGASLSAGVIINEARSGDAVTHRRMSFPLTPLDFPRRESARCVENPRIHPAAMTAPQGTVMDATP